jgi:hypothetical protein
MTTDKQKEEDRRTRIQHPHMIKSKAHWDWESGYSEYDESTDQKTKQQDMTELNGDGNRERGRNGEDLKNK